MDRKGGSIMPRKGFVKPDSKQDKKNVLKKRFSELEGLDKAHEVIVNKLNEGKPATDQELRFLEHYPSRRRQIIEDLKQKKKGDTTFKEGTLRRMCDDLYRVFNVLSKGGYSRSKEGLIRLLEEKNYYLCQTCGYTHKKDEECPVEELAKKLKINMNERVTDAQLDTLIE